ncbi:MAG: hypothetical protein OEX01_02425 [Candidatus Bathyarchaeota archaeon]|nr:hypothetical protein [Candidatus Bathyarchaeota archaeon]
MPNENVLDTHYSLNYDIPSVTFEAAGGFNLCSSALERGKRLHKASVSSVIEQL